MMVKLIDMGTAETETQEGGEGEERWRKGGSLLFIPCMDLRQFLRLYHLFPARCAKKPTRKFPVQIPKILRDVFSVGRGKKGGKGGKNNEISCWARHSGHLLYPRLSPPLPPLPPLHPQKVSVNSSQNLPSLSMPQHIIPQPMILPGTGISKCILIPKR